MLRLHVSAALAALPTLLAGCRGEAPREAAPAAEAPAAAYAPFGVAVDGAHWFRTVSFKDVGLRARSEADRRAVIEAVADAFAHRLHVPAHLEHDPALADPAWHTQCRGHHLYVDLWRSTDPERLGFSLWKGCDADDQVAWAEVPAPPSALESPAWLDLASRLGETIAETAPACPDAHC